MKKNLFCFYFIMLITSNARAQFSNVTFDYAALPGPNMDYAMTVDTGNYIIYPRPLPENETRFYGRKETDSSYTGFNYSNVQDSITPGKINDRAAYPAIGAEESTQYAIAQGVDNGMNVSIVVGYKPTMNLPSHVFHLYVTNATTTALSMKNGDSIGKKFGGINGTDPDWLMLTIKGYHRWFNGTTDSILSIDSTQVYLADFRSDIPAQDFILKDWQKIDLTHFNMMDSLSFHLSSSDTDSTGMKTPPYFCIDNFRLDSSEGIYSANKNNLDVSIYPNPVWNVLNIKSAIRVNCVITNISGQPIKSTYNKVIDLTDLMPGLYFIKITDEKSKRFSSFTFTKM